MSPNGRPKAGFRNAQQEGTPVSYAPINRSGSARVEDQAAGLRQLFSQSQVRFIPLLSNPHVAFTGVMLERLASAYGELGHHTLVVDAAERAPLPQELSLLDLAEGIESLAPQASYLAARGLSLRYVDAQGSTASFLQAVAEAAPHAAVVLVHAPASELARLFAHRAVRPLLLADDRPDSVTHAYAGLKLLAQRAGLMAHDLLLAAAPHSPRAGRIATHLAQCADQYVGAVLHDCVRIDPASAATDATDPLLQRFVRTLMLACEPGAASLEPRVPAHTPNDWMSAAAARNPSTRALHDSALAAN